MDRLKQEHNFITELWQFMKKTDSIQLTDTVADQLIKEVDNMAKRYKDLPFAKEFLDSWMAELDRRDRDEIKRNSSI